MVMRDREDLRDGVDQCHRLATLEPALTEDMGQRRTGRTLRGDPRPPVREHTVIDDLRDARMVDEPELRACTREPNVDQRVVIGGRELDADRCTGGDGLAVVAARCHAVEDPVRPDPVTRVELELGGSTATHGNSHASGECSSRTARKVVQLAVLARFAARVSRPHETRPPRHPVLGENRLHEWALRQDAGASIWCARNHASASAIAVSIGPNV
jgi:hypothetical protein